MPETIIILILHAFLLMFLRTALIRNQATVNAVKLLDSSDQNTAAYDSLAKRSRLIDVLTGLSLILAAGVTYALLYHMAMMETYHLPDTITTAQEVAFTADATSVLIVLMFVIPMLSMIIIGKMISKHSVEADLLAQAVTAGK